MPYYLCRLASPRPFVKIIERERKAWYLYCLCIPYPYLVGLNLISQIFIDYKTAFAGESKRDTTIDSTVV